jgi:stage II sporulation protein M
MKLCRNKFSIEKQKKIYLVFISMILLSVIFGFFFYFIISDGNKKLVIGTQKDFFNNINAGSIKYLSSFFNSFFSNFLYLFLIFILGLSVVGFIFIIGIVLVKGFILGFSISSIVGTFGFKGIVLSFVYIFPHQILFLILLLLMSFYGCGFCYKLFKHLFLRSIINFRKISEKYFKVFLITLACSLLCSLYEVFVLPSLISILL